MRLVTDTSSWIPRVTDSASAPRHSSSSRLATSHDPPNAASYASSSAFTVSTRPVITRFTNHRATPINSSTAALTNTLPSWRVSRPKQKDGAQHRHHGGGHEMGMLDGVSPQYQNRHVDEREDAEQERRGRCPEGLYIRRAHQNDADERHEQDRHHRRPSTVVNLAEESRNDPLVGHAVDESGPHDEVNEGAVAHRNEGYEREQGSGQGKPANLHHLQQRSGRVGERSGGDDHRRGERNQ
jgi:hypothetical protein